MLCICFSKIAGNEFEGDKEYLATGSTDKNIILWNINDESDTMILKGHDDSVTAILALPDLQTFFILFDNYYLKCCHWLSRQKINTLRYPLITDCNNSSL